MEALEFKIETTPAKITGNFDSIKKQLDELLKKYDLIVDEGSVKVAKKMATEINKLSKQIDTLRKEEIFKLNAPINEMDTKARALMSTCQVSRQKLLAQIKVFDDKIIETLLGKLKNEVELNYKHYGVREEFQTVACDDLAIISNNTKTGTGISKKASTEIANRVNAVKQHQEKIDNRLLTLKGTCFEAGLEAPFTKEDIIHFLMEPDETYNVKLNSLIQREISRISVMKKKIEEKAIVQAQKTVEPKIVLQQTSFAPPMENVQIVQQTSTPKKQVSSQYAHFQNVNEFSKPSTMRTYTVTATFEVEMDESKAYQLEQMLQMKFAKGGFKTQPFVHVQEASNVRHA